MRTVHPDTLAALEKPNATWVALVDIDWPGGSLRRTDAGAAVTDRSRDPDEVYEPTREIVDLGQIRETAEPKANTLRITLDAVSPEMVGAVLSGSTAAWTVRVRGAALDDAGEIVGAPLLLFAGRASGDDVRAGGDSPTIDLEVSSHWAAWRVKRGRLTSPESQAAHHPGDRGFDFAGLETGDLTWGKA